MLTLQIQLQLNQLLPALETSHSILKEHIDYIRKPKYKNLAGPRNQETQNNNVPLN